VIAGAGEVVDALAEAFYATFQNVEPCKQPVPIAASRSFV